MAYQVTTGMLDAAAAIIKAEPKNWRRCAPAKWLWKEIKKAYPAADRSEQDQIAQAALKRARGMMR